MKNISRLGGALFTLAILWVPGVTRAQAADTVVNDTTAERLGLWARTSRSSGLIISSAKTYNRVEGLPVYIGPSFHDSAGAAEFNLSVLGIIRSANTFHWDDQNLGHRIVADMRVGRGRGYGVGISSYDAVTPVETWHLPDPDAGLAAFFGHRDFRDYFNRHGAKATATFNMSGRSSFSVDWSDERWTPVNARGVFSVFGNGKAWRANPVVDAGRFHLGVARANIDTRNDEVNPSTGWLIVAEYERGSGRLTDAGPASALARPAAAPSELSYGRMLLDLRRYNRLSPRTWINARLVLGGWLHGDQLPLERRFSVGGIGTIPGFDFRKFQPGTVDVSQCSDGAAPPPGNPAQCERVALAQLEYRNELHSSFFDFLNSRPIRLRGIGFTVQPTAVAFVDAGRGWLVGPPSGTLQYSSRSFPRFGSFRTDVGLGLDLGILGVYVAKAVSSSKEPANVFLRVHRRF
ncbi:MAG: outer membrane protein assembly factor [Gemmatimonadota bacterium]|nr:outer membrane protein assembly factor [Gemmatimonadota bacterium]